MKIKLTKKWLEKYEGKKHLLVPSGNLNRYFTENEIAGEKVEVFSIGEINIPTGEILVRDPFVYLNNSEDNVPYFQSVPVGKFLVEICAVVSEDDCARYAAIKINFTKEAPIRYEEALLGNENLDEVEKGEYFGFGVDAGLGTIVDKKVAESYIEFQNNWYKNNPDKNIYDEYFVKIFKKSYEEHPKYQRSGGDWINWTIPNTDYQVPMFQSGFGDGVYPVYFGYDKNNQICQLVIEFIDIELAYSEEEEEE